MRQQFPYYTIKHKNWIVNAHKLRRTVQRFQTTQSLWISAYLLDFPCPVCPVYGAFVARFLKNRSGAPPYLGVEQFLNVIAETGLSTYPQKSAYQESYFSQELQWFAKQGESHIYW